MAINILLHMDKANIFEFGMSYEQNENLIIPLVYFRTTHIFDIDI